MADPELSLLLAQLEAGAYGSEMEFASDSDGGSTASAFSDEAGAYGSDAASVDSALSAETTTVEAYAAQLATVEAELAALGGGASSEAALHDVYAALDDTASGVDANNGMMVVEAGDYRGEVLRAQKRLDRVRAASERRHRSGDAASTATRKSVRSDNKERIHGVGVSKDGAFVPRKSKSDDGAVGGAGGDGTGAGDTVEMAFAPADDTEEIAFARIRSMRMYEATVDAAVKNSKDMRDIARKNISAEEELQKANNAALMVDTTPLSTGHIFGTTERGVTAEERLKRVEGVVERRIREALQEDVAEVVALGDDPMDDLDCDVRITDADREAYRALPEGVVRGVDMDEMRVASKAVKEKIVELQRQLHLSSLPLLPAPTDKDREGDRWATSIAKHGAMLVGDVSAIGLIRVPSSERNTIRRMMTLRANLNTIDAASEYAVAAENKLRNQQYFFGYDDTDLLGPDNPSEKASRRAQSKVTLQELFERDAEQLVDESGNDLVEPRKTSNIDPNTGEKKKGESYARPGRVAGEGRFENHIAFLARVQHKYGEQPVIEPRVFPYNMARIAFIKVMTDFEEYRRRLNVFKAIFESLRISLHAALSATANAIEQAQTDRLQAREILERKAGYLRRMSADAMRERSLRAQKRANAEAAIDLMTQLVEAGADAGTLFAVERALAHEKDRELDNIMEVIGQLNTGAKDDDVWASDAKNLHVDWDSLRGANEAVRSAAMNQAAAALVLTSNDVRARLRANLSMQWRDIVSERRAVLRGEKRHDDTRSALSKAASRSASASSDGAARMRGRFAEINLGSGAIVPPILKPPRRQPIPGNAYTDADAAVALARSEFDYQVQRNKYEAYTTALAMAVSILQADADVVPAYADVLAATSGARDNLALAPDKELGGVLASAQLKESIAAVAKAKRGARSAAIKAREKTVREQHAKWTEGITKTEKILNGDPAEFTKSSDGAAGIGASDGAAGIGASDGAAGSGASDGAAGIGASETDIRDATYLIRSDSKHNAFYRVYVAIRGSPLFVELLESKRRNFEAAEALRSGKVVKDAQSHIDASIAHDGGDEEGTEDDGEHITRASVDGERKQAHDAASTLLKLAMGDERLQRARAKRPATKRSASSDGSYAPSSDGSDAPSSDGVEAAAYGAFGPVADAASDMPSLPSGLSAPDGGTTAVTAGDYGVDAASITYSLSDSTNLV